MRPFLYKFFHRGTIDRTEGGLVHVPENIAEWPEAWKTIEYKRYGILPHIPLPRSSGHFFEKLLSVRSSNEKMLKGNHINPESLSYLLRCGYGLRRKDAEGRPTGDHRTAPSAGGRYPLELYVFLFKSTHEYASGIYHYGIRTHNLEPYIYREFSENDIATFTPLSWLHKARGMIVISGVFERMVDKYGSRGYRYMLLEAGHVGQNILLAGVECGTHVFPIGGVDDDIIERLLGLNSEREKVLYTLFF